MSKLLGAVTPGTGPAVEFADVLAALTPGEKDALATELDPIYGPGGTAGSIDKPTAQGVALVQALIYGS